MTRIEVLSSYKPVPGFQGGTVGQTAVTKIEKIRHGFGHYSFYTFCPICPPGTISCDDVKWGVAKGKLIKLVKHRVGGLLQRSYTV